MSSIFYVYLHVHPITNIPFYVGKGRDTRAWDVSNRSRHHQSHLQNILNQGFLMNDVVQIVMSELTEDEAFDAEKQLITEYGKKSDKSGCLLNLAEGGRGGDTGVGPRFKEERIGAGNPNFGLKRSSQTKKKMSEANKRFWKSSQSTHLKSIISKRATERNKSLIKGSKWFNNGIIDKRFKEPPNNEWVLGRLCKPIKGLKRWSDGENDRFTKECPGPKWKLGSSKSYKQNLKKPYLKNTKWWTDGIRNKQAYTTPGNEWHLGFTNKRYNKEK